MALGMARCPRTSAMKPFMIVHAAGAFRGFARIFSSVATSGFSIAGGNAIPRSVAGRREDGAAVGHRSRLRVRRAGDQRQRNQREEQEPQ